MTRVFYSSWQMQCCGTPFSVGDTVAWEAEAIPPEKGLRIFGPAVGYRLGWMEDHHGTATGPLSKVGGRVIAIGEVTQEYQEHPRGGAFVPVDGEAFEVEVESIDVWRPERDPNHPERHFIGYVVTLE